MNSQNKNIFYHPFVVAFCNFVLVMLLYSLTRLFFFFITRDAYSDITTSHFFELMAGGLRFDLTALLYLNSLYLLLMLLPFKFRQNGTYQTVAKWCYWVPNIVGLLVNCGDMAYMQFTGRRTTITFLSEFQNDGNLGTIILKGIGQYWYITLFFIACCAILILLTRKRTICETNLKPLLYYIRESVIFVASVYFIVIGIRGGFGAYTRPITLSNALQYTNHPNETNIVLNTPFAIMRSTESESIPRLTYFEAEKAASVMTPVHEGSHDNFDAKNVVVIIIESFSKEYIGYFNHDLESGTYQGYTPFLDSLLQHSVTYPLSLASGRKSIDAMPSVLSSIPMIISPYILTPYSTNKVSSIADCLNRKGYETAFFHGAPNGSMGFQAYARSAGFGAYYGLDEYDCEGDFDGVWAIWDEPFLQFYARKMTEMKQPFMTAVFTASSHHPFQVPAEYEGVFPDGTIPIHKCVGYTDNALRKFFDFAKTQPWYENTLFVITADHTNQLTFPEYLNDKGIFEVPIVFFDPQMSDSLLNIVHNEPISQTDIMPSVLNYLHYDADYFAFGQDGLTQTKQHPYAINYNNGLYQIFTDSLLIQFDGSEVKAVYNFKQDRLLHDNIAGTTDIDSALGYLKAYLEQYTNRLIDNRFTLE